MTTAHFSFTRLLLIGAVLLVSAGCSVTQYELHGETVESGHSEIQMAMGDGTLLATDIYLPKRRGPFPVVLVRTPYDKSADQWMGKAFNLFGIAVVLQDVRGKYKSEGEFYPFINERSDGLQTLRWIRQQPWCDGTVSGWGASYLGYTQWAVSDSLDFLTLLVTGANLYDFVYPDGHFSLQSAFVWGFQNASPELNQISSEELVESLKILPLSVADDSTITEIPFITDWLTNETYNDYWENLDFRGKTTAPILSMAGWYDIFLKTQIEDFQALSDNGNPDNRLIIGPWCHGSMGEPNEYGGLKKTGKPSKIFKYVKNHLKGRKVRLTDPLKNSKYNLFIMERNEYVASDVWPPKETAIVPYYLGPDSTLSTISSQESGVLTYTYDPSDPYPSYGGTALGENVGPARQNANYGRSDQLVFEMQIYDEPLILLGPVSANLWLSTDAPCTDFVVGIQDRFPDGKLINIQEGITRVSGTKGEPVNYEISVWATGYQINPGHSLRVVISSSWFPRFNRSLNACEPILSADKMQTARQTVYFGGNTASSINLPIYNLED